jgi:hypothetical protein
MYVYAVEALGLDPDKVNVNGYALHRDGRVSEKCRSGAIALGSDRRTSGWLFSDSRETGIRLDALAYVKS